METHPARQAPGPVSETAEGEGTQPPEPDFEEPAATEDREDPGTDVSPSRLDVPIDPGNCDNQESRQCYPRGRAWVTPSHTSYHPG